MHWRAVHISAVPFSAHAAAAVVSMRIRLNTRHPSVTTKIAWRSGVAGDQHLIVTYGLDERGRIKEAFCASFRAAGDVIALANDARILFSRLLQHGDDLLSIAKSLGEDRVEGAASGPPSSLVGAIARKAVEIESGH